VLAGVISGVGFLGGGVILARHGRVQGVTTAAMIWILAAVGATIGLGQYAGAIAMTLIVLAIVNMADLLEEVEFCRRRRARRSEINCESEPEDHSELRAAQA